MRRICRFDIPEASDRELLESGLALAVLSAEGAFGRGRVRLDGAYAVSDDGRHCAIDVDTDVGQHIAGVVVELLTRELGEDAFTVTRKLVSPDVKQSEQRLKTLATQET